MAKTIVWIDDDTEIIDAVVHPLERVGHQVRRLHTESEALAAIDQLRHADLLLLAMIFPPFDSPVRPIQGPRFDRYTGLHLLRLLREVYHITTPVIVLTAVNSDELDRSLQALDVAAPEPAVIRASVIRAELP